MLQCRQRHWLAARQQGRGDHAVAAGQTTWHDYARYVIDHARRAGVPLKTPADGIAPVPTSAFPTPARRPGNSRLSTAKLQAAFELVLPDWQQGVARMLDEILPATQAPKG